MLNVVWWLITIYVIGLVAFPLIYQLFPGMRDRGYGISKAFGILLLGYVSWILSSAHVVPSVRLVILLLLIAAGAISVWLLFRNRKAIAEFVKRERVFIFTTELIFLTVFVGWTVYRAFDPFISHTEQPMDFAFLNASIRTVWAPPSDPWLSGHSVSYYYFGYWLMGSITEITAIKTSIAYNLSLSLIPALASVGLFALTFNLVALAGARRSIAIGSGIVTVILLAFAANLHGVLEFMRANDLASSGFWEWLSIEGMTTSVAQVTSTWHPTEFWWWWRATRVINTFTDGMPMDFTIQEFPFFSALLGDLHPHFMSLAFIPIFLTIGLQFLLSPLPKWRDRRIRTWVPILVFALVLGGLGFINAWDFPVFGLLLVGIVGLKAFSIHGCQLKRIITTSLPWVILILALAFLLYLPYFIGFRSQFAGLRSVAITTRPLHFVIVWGLLLVAVVPLVVSDFWHSTMRRDWGWLLRVGLFLALTPFFIWTALHLWNNEAGGEISRRFLHVLPLMILAAIAIYTALSHKQPIHFRQQGLQLPYQSRKGESDSAVAVVEAVSIAERMGGQVLWIRESSGQQTFDIGLKPPREMSQEKFEAVVAELFDEGTPFGKTRISTRDRNSMDPQKHSSHAFVLVLVSLAALLLIAPEFMYAADFFNTRMNTIFKLYYQAWLLFALAGGFAFYYWFSRSSGARGWERLGSRLWAVAFMLLVIPSLYYAPASATSKAHLNYESVTLDGLDHLVSQSPGELKVIQYLDTKASRETVILEAVGGSYTEFGRIASSSGVQTVLGWPGHEHQWRGSSKLFKGRADDVRQIYSTADIDEAKSLLRKYNVEYVYVGSRERESYGAFGTEKFAAFMETIIQYEGSVLYRVNGPIE